MTATSAGGNEMLLHVADEVLERRMSREPFVALGLGKTVVGLAALSPAAVESDSSFYGQQLGRLKSIGMARLSTAERAFLGALRFDLQHRMEAARHRLLDFVITPYRGGDLHTEAREALATCDVSTAAGLELHDYLVRDYVRLVDEMAERTIEQRRQGIVLAQPALFSARSSLDSLVHTANAFVRPALQRLRSLLDDEYAAGAPAGVGLGLYEDGDATYRSLISARADSDASAEDIHSLGLSQVAQLEEAKAELHARIGGRTTRTDFERQFLTGPEWIATSAEEVESRFTRYLSRLEPVLPRWFGRLPGAPWAVTRADPAVEAAMSYGYYERPTATQPVGRYRYNGSRLDERSMIGAQHLIYHELMPGHHLQLSLQSEAHHVHPLQAHLHSMAAVEGWAVYASELAREMGLYADYELYGHYVMQSFLAARLVVDTGLNALGWSLKRARSYLREHTLESASLIDAEILRYSTDIPAQALAYNLGRRAIEAARSDAARRLGKSFEVRSFHDAVLEVGGLPLPVLAERIEAWVGSS